MNHIPLIIAFSLIVISCSTNKQHHDDSKMWLYLLNYSTIMVFTLIFIYLIIKRRHLNSTTVTTMSMLA